MESMEAMKDTDFMMGMKDMDDDDMDNGAKKFVPYSKMSKKQKRAMDKKQRVTWEINPSSTYMESDKKRAKRRDRRKRDNYYSDDYDD